MSHKIIAQLIRDISGQNNTLAIPRVYIRLLHGDIEAAIFLSQCVYWSDKTKNKNGFYKTATEWEEETGLTRYKVSRCAKACQQWVKTSLHRANGAPTLHYLVNLSSLCDSVSDLLVSSKSDFQETSKSDFQETSKSLTEITQKVAEQRDRNPASDGGASDFSKLVKIYEDNINLVVPMIAEELRDALALYPLEWCEQAILESVKAGVRNWNYTAAILARWKKDGRQSRRGNGKGGPARNLPDVASTTGGFYA